MSDGILAILTSEGFLEKAALLILGAALTGILVPLVKARMDRGTFERQKIFEAQLARQSDVIKAQTQFLHDFSNYIWEYHMISQRVSHARLSGIKATYDKAVQEYRDSLWHSLSKIRGAIGAARWFCSDAAHKALSSWYEEWFVQLEFSLRELIEKDPSPQEWTRHHQRVHYEASTKNYGLLTFLAEEFGLGPMVEDRVTAEEDPSARSP